MVSVGSRVAVQLNLGVSVGWDPVDIGVTEDQYWVYGFLGLKNQSWILQAGRAMW